MTIIEGSTLGGKAVTGQSLRNLLADRIDLMPPFRRRIKDVRVAVSHGKVAY